MTRQEIEQRAFELHDGGYHCAESVLLALSEAHGNGRAEGLSPRIATCFGGGVGRTHQEMCGALAGGLLALGALHGRDRRHGNWDRAAELASALRQKFIARFGASACKDVLAGLGEQENMAKCKRLSGITAGLASELLRETREASESCEACACMTVKNDRQ
ncbi:MAG: C-GCAxxG-C-C family (seleno)protein [Acidobacteriota bacterium]